MSGIETGNIVRERAGREVRKSRLIAGEGEAAR